MPRGEDSHDYLLRRAKEYRDRLGEIIKNGNVEEGGKNGYWAHAKGYRVCCDMIQLIEEVLFGRGVTTRDEHEPKVSDRYL